MMQPQRTIQLIICLFATFFAPSPWGKSARLLHPPPHPVAYLIARLRSCLLLLVYLGRIYHNKRLAKNPKNPREPARADPHASGFV